MNVTIDNPQVRAFISYCKHERGLAVNTVDAYRIDLKCFDAFVVPKLGCMWKVADVTADICREYIVGMSKAGRSGKTCNRHRSTIQCFMRFHGSTKADDMAVAQTEHTLPKAVDPEVLGRLIDGAEDPIDRMILELMYSCGLRVSEVYEALLHCEGDCISVIGKGDAQRLVPCNDYIRANLPAFNGRRKESRWKLYRRVQMSGKRVGIPDLHPHQLRHSFASHLLNGGADIRVIQEMMGHASINTTQGYTEVDLRARRETIRNYHPRERTNATGLPGGGIDASRPEDAV